MPNELAAALTAACNAPGTSLAEAALVIARVEYPRLRADRYIDILDGMGQAALERIERHAADTGDASALGRARALGAYLFEELQFAGNRDKPADARNSCLNQVLERRTGIPITLSVVYLEVARRAGVPADGVSFPGRFLVRCADGEGPGEVIDPFNRGAALSEDDCRRLLEHHAGDDVPFSRALLAPATRAQIVTRMLLNLKHLYVHMRSFPQAYAVTELLVAMSPSALGELRDRGLLAYHLNDVSSALHDLQAYLRLASMSHEAGDEEDGEERQQIWEHVKTLRRRVASLN